MVMVWQSEMVAMMMSDMLEGSLVVVGDSGDVHMHSGLSVSVGMAWV